MAELSCIKSITEQRIRAQQSKILGQEWNSTQAFNGSGDNLLEMANERMDFLLSAQFKHLNFALCLVRVWAKVRTEFELLASNGEVIRTWDGLPMSSALRYFTGL